MFFFFAEYQLYKKTAGHLRGGAHPQHPPPGSAPGKCYTKTIKVFFSFSFKAEIMHEAEVMMKLDHPNIVRIIGTV